jgi:ATP-binding protein involved in chromosome partitioning
MPIQESDVQNAIRSVKDPELPQDLMTLGLVQLIEIDEKSGVRVRIALTPAMHAMKDRLQAKVEQAIKAAAAGNAPSVTIEFAAAPPAQEPDVLPGVRHVIAVGAGKGGVGKSTISTLLALGLARSGANVGLLDGDIYGPSLGTMLGLDTLDTLAEGNTLMPFDVHGIKAMTIAKLVDPDKPMIWRGPMAHKAFSQLLLQTGWGELDYLIVDLPPGTGDVPLSLAQSLPLTGAVIVCTPQRVAQDDARRAVRMFGELSVPILGLVENMSWFETNDGQEYDIFGRGGAENLAADMNIPFLGPLPLHISMRQNADAGTPLDNFSINDDITTSIEQLASELAAQVVAQDTGVGQPTISMS